MKKYQIILADPPWRQFKGGKKAVRPNSSGSPLPYSTLDFNEINKIIGEVAVNFGDTNHILFLWTIEKYLYEAEEMAYWWSYRLHARMIWNKVTGIPTAFTIRFGHEYLLYMYRGKFLPVAKEERGKIHSVFTEQVKEHSRKPEIAYRIIERLYSNTNKLELFARPVSPLFPKRQGWDVWGNEVESDIELLTQPKPIKGEEKNDERNN